MKRLTLNFHRKLPEKVPRNTITKKVASLFAGKKDPPTPGFEVIRKGQSHYSPKRVVEVSEQVVKQPVLNEGVKHKKSKTRSKDVQSLAVTIPLQNVPLRIKLHVSGVPRDQYLTATIVSGPPSDGVVEEEPEPASLATAAKDHSTGVEESIYPIEMSGALSEFMSVSFKDFVAADILFMYKFQIVQISGLESTSPSGSVVIRTDHC